MKNLNKIIQEEVFKVFSEGKLPKKPFVFDWKRYAEQVSNENAYSSNTIKSIMSILDNTQLQPMEKLHKIVDAVNDWMLNS